MSHRIERVNTLLKREISGLIQHELRDPRLDEFIAVTDVETTQDLQHAKVFVSSLSGQQEEAKILAILNGASGFLRTALAHNVTMRRVPDLHFVWDNSIEHGDRILRLIDEVSQKDNP
jgi:ribosome-binding factor A